MGYKTYNNPFATAGAVAAGAAWNYYRGYNSSSTPAYFALGRDTQFKFQEEKKRKRPSMSTREWTRSRRRKTFGRKTVSKVLYAATAPYVDRFQGVTNFDTNGGYYALSVRESPAPELSITTPIHIYDISGIPNGTVAPFVGYGLGWEDKTDPVSACRRTVRYGSDHGGSIAATWDREYGKPLATSFTRGKLDWVSVKLNLYGARTRDTYFRVQVVQFHNDASNLASAPVTNLEVRELLQDLERPLIYSNLLTSSYHSKKGKMKVLNSYFYKVPAKNSTDLNTSAGNIHEANCFFRLNKPYNFDWDENGDNIAHEAGDGEKFENDYATRSLPFRHTRYYLMIQAFCPERVSVPASYAAYTPEERRNPAEGTALNVDIEPSYDMLIRRRWTLPVSSGV